MRKKLLFLFICYSSLSMLFAYEKIEIKTPKEGYSTDSVLANIEATYDHNMPLPFKYFRDSVYVKAEKALQYYLSKIKNSCNLSALEEYIYELLLDASQKELGEEDIIRYASIYLMCGGKGYAHIAYQALAIAYANLGDKENLRYVLHCFEKSDINKDGEFNAQIESMRNSMASILYPTDMTLSTPGVWVSDISTNRKKYYSFPYSIIDIRALTDDGIFSFTLPSYDNSQITSDNRFRNFSMAQLVEFDNPTENSLGRISTIFSSQHFQQGVNTSAGFEQTRQFQADMQGKIASSNMSVGAHIGASVATTAISTLMNMALLEMAQSSHTVATMTLDLNPRTEDVMIGHMKFIYHTFKTSRPDEEPEPIYDNNIKFLRWLPEDTICFINHEKRPFNPYNLYLDKGVEVVNQYSWKNPKYAGMLAAFIIGGVGLYAGGMGIGLSAHKNNAQLSGGMSMAVIGGIGVGVIAPVILDAVRRKKQKATIEQFNQSQLETLRKKRNSASVTIIPVANPWEKSGGVSIDIKY